MLRQSIEHQTKFRSRIRFIQITQIPDNFLALFSNVLEIQIFFIREFTCHS